MEKPNFIYEQESQSNKLARKSKEMPVFPIGKYEKFMLTKYTCYYITACVIIPALTGF